MQDRDLIISQIRQRLEILYQMIEELESGGGGEPGSNNYNDLSNKPSINNITLTGNKTTTQLGLASAAQINQTNTNVSNLTNTVNDIFTPDNITLNDGGFFPQIAMEWISLHKPIEVNNDVYYFIEETGVDYLYVSIPPNGAYPSTSYLRIMKDNRKVEFHNTIIETTPIENSDNLLTSGAIYNALEEKVDKVAGMGLSQESFTTAEKEKLATLKDYYTRDPSATITSNSDLDNYTAPGRYGCNTGSIAATIANSPYTTSGYRLEVIETTGNNLMQQLLPNNMTLANGAYYVRTYAAGTGIWSSWYRYTGTEVV